MQLLKERITEARVGSGVGTASDLARLCKVKPSAIAQLELGTTKTLKATTAVALSKATGYRIEYLVLGQLPKLVAEPVDSFDAPRMVEAAKLIGHLLTTTKVRLNPEGVVRAAITAYHELARGSTPKDTAQTLRGTILALAQDR